MQAVCNEKWLHLNATSTWCAAFCVNLPLAASCVSRATSSSAVMHSALLWPASVGWQAWQ